MNKLLSRSLTLSLLGVLVLLPGCSSNAKPRKPTHPVNGQVLFEGRPLAGAYVSFHPQDGDPDQPRSGARTDHEGRFRMSTYDAFDGVPAGKYLVTITLDEEQDTVAQIPARYGNPNTSGLRVEVREGTNELPPFRLVRPTEEE